MDGTAYTGYTDADWRYGKVAYDLNEYYLDKRFGDGSKCGYVDNIYANGDYLYAGYEFENISVTLISLTMDIPLLPTMPPTQWMKVVP